MASIEVGLLPLLIVLSLYTLYLVLWLFSLWRAGREATRRDDDADVFWFN